MNKDLPIWNLLLFNKTSFCWAFLLSFFFLFTTTLSAQFTIGNDRFYGRAGYDELQIIKETTDGYFLFGTRGDTAPWIGGPSTNNGSTDFWVVKVDFDGNILWEEIYGGSGNDTLEDVIETPDGGFLLGGFSYSDISGDRTVANRGERDMWIVKISATGLYQWDAAYGGDREDYLKRMIPTADNGFILTGWTNSSVSGEVTGMPRGGDTFDCWAVKIDATGNLEWDKRFGGDQEDLCQDVFLMPDGGFMFAAQSRSDISGEKTEDAFGAIGGMGFKSLDYWIVRTDADGNILWDRTYGGINSDAPHGIVPTLDGNYIIGGYARSPRSQGASQNGNKNADTRGAQDYWVIKIDPNGNKLWDRAYGGSEKDIIRHIKLVSKNNIALIGDSESPLSGDKTEETIGLNDYWLVLIDQNGDIVYQKTLGGNHNDNMHDFLPASNGCEYLGVGFTFSEEGGQVTDTNNGLQDGWVTRFYCDMEVDIGNDTLVCETYPFFLNALDSSIDACEYLWGNGETTPTVTVVPMTDTMYAVTVTNTLGCIKADTIHIQVKETPIFELGDDTAICINDSIQLSIGSVMPDEILWNTGETTPTIYVSEPGAYFATLTNDNECEYMDAIIINNYDLPVFDLGADQSICPDESLTLQVDHPGPIYTWSTTSSTGNSTSVSEEGIYYVTVTDNNTCQATDSVVISHYYEPTVNLGNDTTICSNLPFVLDATDENCPNCTYEWDDASTEAIRTLQSMFNMTYSVTVTSENGCTASDEILVFANPLPTVNLGDDEAICQGDSVLISINLTGNPPYNVVIDDGTQVNTLTVEDNEESFWVYPTETTTYTILLAEDSSLPESCLATGLVQKTITVYEHKETNLDIMICDGESHFAQGLEQTETGIYFDTLMTQHNCDSVVITNLTVNQLDTTEFVFETCIPSEAGSDTLFLQNQYTCDSLVITTTNLLPSDTMRFFETTCEASEAGLDTMFLQNQYTCDSIIITETALLPSDTVQLSYTSCNIDEVGVDTTFLQNQFMCDSVIIETTILLPSDTISLSFESCDPTDVGIDTMMLNNQYGCDSMVIQTTTLLPSDTFNMSLITCEASEAGIDTFFYSNQYGCDSLIIQTSIFASSDTIEYNFTTCLESEVSSDTAFLTNVLGCDSLVIETTTLLPSDTVIAGATTCIPTEAGVDTLFLQNQYGCDSLYITTTVLLPSNEMEFFFTSCDPQEVGIDTLSFSNEYGCDSLIINITDLLPTDTINLLESSCDASLVGIDTMLLQNQYGCDSLVIVNTELLPSDTIYIMVESCEPSEVGIDTLFENNQYGCDSLLITTTILLPTDTTNIQEETCDQAALEYEEILEVNQYGCDSLVVIERTIFPLDTTLLDANTCVPEEAGLDTLWLNNQYGCDSMIITNAIFSDTDSTFIEVFTCDESEAGVETEVITTALCDSVIITTTIFQPSDTLLNANTTCDPSQVENDTLFLFNQYGCDSLVINLTVLLPSDTLYFNNESCDPNQVGIDTLFEQNQYGCDSLLITTTILLPTDITNLQEETCDQAALEYEEILDQNQYGCDSLIVIERTIHPLDTTLLDATSCEPAEAGIDTMMLLNQYGCDSMIITNTIFAESDSTFIEVFTCDEEAVGIDIQTLSTNLCDSIVITTTILMEDDTTYLATTSCNPNDAGVFVEVLSTQMGCDSIVIETVTHSQSDTTYLQVNVCSALDTGLVETLLTNQYGCDSLVFSQNILSTDTTYIYETSCFLNEVGEFSESYANSAGCDSTILTIVDLLEGNVQIFTEFTCDENDVSSDTTFYVNSVGCDSLIIETIELLQIDLSVDFNNESCSGENDGSLSVQSAVGGEAPYLYALNDGGFSSNTSFNNLSPGIYTLVVQDINGCEDSAQIEIEAAELFEVELGENVYLNLGESAILDLESNQSINSFVWNDTTAMDCPSCPSTMVSPPNTTTYSVTAINDEGCEAFDQVIYIVERQRLVYIPSAFSPNEDNINDIFQVFVGPGVAKIHSIMVADRWGELVYNNTSEDILELNQGWDGTLRGKPMNPQVFVYIVEVEYIDGVRETFRGDLTLMR